MARRMTNAELQALLSEFPGDMPVVFEESTPYRPRLIEIEDAIVKTATHRDEMYDGLKKDSLYLKVY